MQTMRYKMQEVLDDAFSFWKDRKLSPRSDYIITAADYVSSSLQRLANSAYFRFNRGRLQPSADDEQPQAQERSNTGLDFPYLPRSRSDFLAKICYC